MPRSDADRSALATDVSSATSADQSRHRRAVRAFLIVAIIVPAAVTALAVVAQLLVLPSLPDPLAVHWRFDGTPDGWAPAWTVPAMTALFGFGLPALIGGTTLVAMRRGDRGMTIRFIGAVFSASTLLVVGLVTATTLVQLHTTDPHLDGVWFMVAGVGALLIGVVAYLVQPRESWQPSPGADAPPLDFGPGERAVWLRTVAVGRVPLVVLGAVVVLMVGVTALIWNTAQGGAATWIVSAVSVLVVLTVVSSSVFHVSVDAQGLRVRSMLGVPRFRVPLDEVREVAVTEVQPMGEFGGWGVRFVPGRTGVVVRDGSALQVTRTNGRQFVVTVDDAATGASLLRALARRAHDDERHDETGVV